MYISRLALDHFRSWNNCLLHCENGINILYGKNGFGKTNIVEAIEVLSTGTSHRVSSVLPLIEREKTSATIRCNLHKDINSSENTTLEVTLFARGANRARINEGKSCYMRDILGKLLSVSFTPQDQSIIMGDPSSRRNFINQAGILLIPNYAKYLQEYVHTAQQRAACLKNIKENNIQEKQLYLSTLEIWTGKLIETGIVLTRLRNKTINLLKPYFSEIVHNLSEGQNSDISYKPSFEELDLNSNSENMLANTIISEHFQRLYLGEVARGYNLIGPHRDDFIITLDNLPAKEFASNGESWTLALALKMALLKALEDSYNNKPIIILDDVFAQLDESRREQILDFATKQGQVFITTTSLRDIPESRILDKANLVDISSLKKENNFDDDENIKIAKNIAQLRNNINYSLVNKNLKQEQDSSSCESSVL